MIRRAKSSSPRNPSAIARATAILASLTSACGSTEASPSPPTPDTHVTCRQASESSASCGTATAGWTDLLATDDRADDLTAKAMRYDRVFAALVTASTGLNIELTVSDPAHRAAIEAFASGGDHDFEASSGLTVVEVVDGWAKVAGAYGGVGIAADAFRYGTLRDTGAPCDEVDRARDRLVTGLDALHVASAITGAEGVVARGFARRDLPGIGQQVETVPLFDTDGTPLPAEKNNGTWREDQSGLYPDVVWEDSCSRDQIAGWIAGYAAAWEVIADDDAFDADLKTRLQQDAEALARSLMQVRDRGYDLEIWDADDRPTFHGIMNENGVDTGYLPGAGNGFNAILSLGIVAALAYVSEASDVIAYLNEELVAERRLHELARDNMLGVDRDEGSNFSSYNMAFLGGWLAQRYLCDDAARAVVTEALATSLYAKDGELDPSEQSQSLYDFVHATAQSGATAYVTMASEPDETAVAMGVDSLLAFPDAPYWDEGRTNCDDTEIAAGTCELDDGTTVTLLGEVGWNDELVAGQPVPMAVRPPSNYHWRSNPYRVNGAGDGARLFPGVDFRFAYWLARWVR